jgi:hypothetical protein
MLTRWMGAVVAQFRSGRIGGFPDQEVRKHALSFIATQVEPNHESAASSAWTMLNGRLLRMSLEDDPSLLPPEATGKVLLTSPPTAFDEELRSKLAEFEAAHPDKIEWWIAAEHRLEASPRRMFSDEEDFEFRQFSYFFTDFLARSCWVQNTIAASEAWLAVRKLLLGRLRLSGGWPEDTQAGH